MSAPRPAPRCWLPCARWYSDPRVTRRQCAGPHALAQPAYQHLTRAACHVHPTGAADAGVTDFEPLRSGTWDDHVSCTPFDLLQLDGDNLISRAGMLLYLQAAFVALLAYVFLGESLHAYHLIGAAIIVAGLLVANLLKPRTAAVPRPTSA
jgi:EamA-like transporter family